MTVVPLIMREYGTVPGGLLGALPADRAGQRASLTTVLTAWGAVTWARSDRWVALITAVASGSAVLLLALAGMLGARPLEPT